MNNFSLLILLAAFAFISQTGLAAIKSVLTNSPAAVAAPNLADYPKWGAVNPKPVFIPSARAAPCAPALPPGSPSDPHEDKYINVYVNPAGRPAMLAGNTHFPAGSIIVKEKLATSTNSRPELLTVMVKRKEGFSPATGDWQFTAMNGAGNKVLPGETVHCATCHEARKESDWVFRKYLPTKPVKPR